MQMRLMGDTGYEHIWTLDTFFSGKNGAGMIFPDSNDSSIQAELNDTHFVHDIKIFGSYLLGQK